MRKLLVTVLAAALVAGLAGAGLAAAVHQADLRPAYERDGLLTILVIGSDLGPPHRPANPLRGRSDGIHILAVDTHAKRATIVDIPRDTLLGGRKASDTMALGGPALLQRRVEELSGLRMDFWILATFASIERLVDGLGGVEIEIEQRMADRFSGSNFHPGRQRLAGWQALAFVRDRKSFLAGDVARSRNQGRLLRAAQAQIRQGEPELPELMRLVGLLARNTASNIPASDLLRLAVLAVQIPPDQIRQVTVPGRAGMTRGGASVLYPAPGDIFTRIRAGHVGP